MAQELKLLAVIWLAAACLITGGASAAADITSPPTTTSSPPTPAKDPTTTSSPPTSAKDPTTTSSPPTSAKDPTTTSSPPTSAKDPTTTSSPPTSAKDPTTTSSPPTSAKDPTTTSSPPTSAKDPTTTSSPPTSAKDPTTTSSPPTSAKDPTTTSSPPTSAKDPTTTSSPPTSAKDPTTTSSPPTPAKDPSATPPPLTTEDLSTSQQQLTTPTPDPCEEEQCGDGSTCVPRADQNFECLCLAGDYYNNNTKNCENAKVFPGHLLLPGMKYTNQMTDTMSTEFLNAYRKIKSEFDNVFEGVLDYENTNVVELRPLTKPKVWALPEVNATVEIIFSASSDISTKEIEKKIENAATCADCLLANAKFAETKLCDKNPCHNKTTECSSGNGSYTCTCLEDYLETDFSNRLCIACPSGQKIQGSICVDCSYGYSGLNCSESWQLALVIIGSVLGGLLLITLTLLPIVAYKSSKKSSKKKKNADTGKPNVSHFPDKAPLVNGNFAKSQAAPVNGSANGPTAFANAGVPRIPRATANNSWDSRTNLEMTPSNSRQNLVPAGRNARLYEDQDDMNSYVQVRPPSSFYAESRPQSSHYSQVRPQNNRYEQSLHQINPYASSQGHTNPYFTNDNGRRFNY